MLIYKINKKEIKTPHNHNTIQILSIVCKEINKYLLCTLYGASVRDLENQVDGNREHCYQYDSTQLHRLPCTIAVIRCATKCFTRVRLSIMFECGNPFHALITAFLELTDFIDVQIPIILRRTT